MEPEQTLNTVTRLWLPRMRLEISVGKLPQPGAATAFSHSGDTITSLIYSYSPVAIKQAQSCFLDGIIPLLIPRMRLGHRPPPCRMCH
jgi:hypothetical protein